MTFRLALSGLNAAQADLDVTANNIANSATNGFKQFARGVRGAVRGVAAGRVRRWQPATACGCPTSRSSSARATSTSPTTTWTWRISGQGFFMLSDGGALAYTRAGAFKTDCRWLCGQRQSAAPAGVSAARRRRFQYRLAVGPAAGDLARARPRRPRNVEMLMNLPANATVPVNATFDPADPTSFNHATSLTVYDSLGAAHTGTMYFVKTATAGDWELAPVHRWHGRRRRADAVSSTTPAC